MALFYLPEAKNGQRYLNTDESRHAIKVLRLQKGSEIKIIDGLGGWYNAKITSTNSKKCEFEIFDTWKEKKNDFYIHIAIAPTKNIDRIEWFVEKAVEIGVDEISFLLCSNSERKIIKIERILKKAISAMKQSMKSTLPIINELVPFKKFINKSDAASKKYIAYVDFSYSKTLIHQAELSQHYTILIGPEGDFSDSELSLALDNGYTKTSLGNSRLRTETAGIIACSQLHFIND